MINLHLADNREAFKKIKTNSVDSIVTDPPYGIKFMNHKWDYNLPDIRQFKECLRILKPGGFMLCFGGRKTHHRMAVTIEDAGFEIHDTIIWAYGQGFISGKRLDDGVSTQLKPSLEIIIVARKQLEGTATSNYEKYKLGGFFFDAVRKDRIPSNLILEDSDEISNLFPNTKVNGSITNVVKDKSVVRGNYGIKPLFKTYGDEGSAARYFSRIQYCSKPSKKEKGINNNHPTVKPVELLEHLIKLVTPEGGVILDPWMGSGTTGVAAVKNKFDFIGIEIDQTYYTTSLERIANEKITD